jgi:phosphatidylglycerol---prolipoprotein diacylglyceryl transferase
VAAGRRPECSYDVLVQPEIHVLGLSIKTFGLFFALNFAAWGALAGRRLRELGKPVDWAYEIVAAALIGGLIGARAYWLAQNHGSLSIGNIFGGTGLIWYGGLAGGVIAVLFWAKWRGFLTLDLVDLAGPCLALGYAIGRIGCQVSGDGDYGRAWNGPWAMGYPHGTVPTPPGETVHPTPIYETLAMGLVAFFLWQLRDRLKPGLLFALYLVIAGLERFLIEFIRRNEDVALGLTAAQLESLSLIVIGAVWLFIVGRRGGILRDDTPDRRAALAAT